MIDINVKKDLIALVADKDMEMTVQGILERPESLKIRKITYDVFVHPRHDPGCYSGSHSFLCPFTTSYSYALVMFDREGCGKDTKARTVLEEEVETRLKINGWGDKRARVIVLDPELESWVWSGSPHVREIIGWKNELGKPKLREWLSQQGFIAEGDARIPRPKETLQAVRRYVGKAKSPSLFYQLAQKVSLKNCQDPSFQKLISVLQEWFPEDISYL